MSKPIADRKYHVDGKPTQTCTLQIFEPTSKQTIHRCQFSIVKHDGSVDSLEAGGDDPLQALCCAISMAIATLESVNANDYRGKLRLYPGVEGLFLDFFKS